MDKKNLVLSLITTQGLLPLYFHADKDVSIEVVKALYKAGVRTVEYTNRGKNALENFIALRKMTDTNLPGLQLGAGTIKNKNAAIEFIDAGADFIISPGMVEEVAEVTGKNNLLLIPGCMTATEIIHAENTGATLIKLFPGNLLGPSYLTAVKEIFPDLLFMPTGGVDVSEKNISAWFKAGVAAVGMGSKLVSKSILENKDFDKITANATDALNIIRKIKNNA